jgi:DNA-binding transcriptional LysR family regulator
VLEATVDLNRVNVFVQVIEKGSFTAAALGLGLPKSSVSRSIAGLEQELGVTLLRRTTRKLTLTDAGQLFFERARNAVYELHEASQTVSDTGDEPRGLVRMTAPSDIGRTLAEPLARFLREHPKIQIDLLLTGRTVDLVAEKIDLALRAGKLADSTLIAKKVGASVVALYASPDYLAQRGRPRRVADLAGHDCVLYRGGGNSQRWNLDGPRGGAAVEVRGPLSCDEMSFVQAALEQGLGIGMLPTPLARLSVDAGRLAPVLPEYSLGGGAVYLVHPAMRHLPRRVSLLRDALFTALRTSAIVS